ncbi:MAG: hypothetical protein ACRD3Q_01685, partial [Terriglobales bacterium]
QYNEREGGVDAALSAELNATLGADEKAAKVATKANPPESAGAGVSEASMPAVALCEQCGLPLPSEGAPCAVCDAETFRPGERLQRTWATMWSISQEQGPLLGNITSPEKIAPAVQPTDISPALTETAGDLAPVNSEDDERDGSLAGLPAGAAIPLAKPNEMPGRRVRRADVYLGLAVIVALVAVFWPAASAGRNQLRPWERMLVAVGIAEAPPQSEVQYRGDPNIKVWVDTQAALYYCPGDELYGKSPGGYYTTQHDAQLDRFEPALRRACVP